MELNRVLESMNIRRLTLRPRRVLTVCFMKNPASNPCEAANSSAPSAERATLLHLEDDQLGTEQLWDASTTSMM